mmetsp:Transcript_30949/g.74753  ORF Transcript_30949/g.74753 Transcript_30949/m.74753 type:complete len:541 (-) Transcript_30949:985-2607(-)
MVTTTFHHRRRRSKNNTRTTGSSSLQSLLVLRFIVLAAVLHATNSYCSCMMVVTRAARSLNSVRSRSVAATAISAAASAASGITSSSSSSSSTNGNSRSSSKKRSSSSSSTPASSSTNTTKNKNSTRAASKSRKQRRTSTAEAISSFPKKTKETTTSSSSPKLENDNRRNVNETRNTDKKLLLSLPEDVVVGILQARPSTRNRSPYVGDVLIPSQNNRVAICHLPNLDMGGQCTPGATIVMKPARDKKGNLVGPDAVSPKFGTPKCEYIAQLLRVDETHLTTFTSTSTSNSDSSVHYEPVWVGAHPSLGEKIAEQLIGQNLLGDDFPEVESFQREVRNPAGLDLRADFLVKHTDPTKRRRIVEVKTVVDTDYSPEAVPPSTPSSPDGKTKKSKAPKKRCVFTSSRVPYRRTGIFPWGNSNQKGPDGEAVVSTRAIKHVRELTRVVVERQYQKKKTVAKKKEEDGDDDDSAFDSTILFVVIRGDADAFRPNIDACPSFARYLKEARDAGVTILAKQVVWGEESDNQLGQCYEGPLLEIEWP